MRFRKHRYDAKGRPKSNELTSHIFEQKHYFKKDIDATILKDKLFTETEREYQSVFESFFTRKLRNFPKRKIQRKQMEKFNVKTMKLILSGSLTTTSIV